MINRMKRFEKKILVAMTVGAFTTFTMLLYVTSDSRKCGSTSGILCFYVFTEDRPNIRTGTESFGGHHLISKAKLFDFKFSPVTTENLSKSADSIRTRRNIYQLSKTSLAGSSPLTMEKVTPLAVKKEEPFHASLKLVGLLNEVNASRMSDYFVNRQRNLQEGCHRYYNGSRTLQAKELKLDHILIDRNKKILFCYVPKVACTNWKRIFLVLSGKADNMSQVIRLPSYKVHEKKLFTTLQNLSQSDVNEILRDYTKLIFVRNPFERLLSAYRNKLEQHYDSSKYFQARFGKYIVKKFRKNPTNVSLSKGDDVKFSEFVDYLVSSNSVSYNEHWQTVMNLCHPCLINYDLVGKYETLIDDSNLVLRYLKLNFSFPVLDKPSRTASSLRTYFESITKDVIFKLYRIYELDFKLFGYDLFKTLIWSNNGS